MSHSDHVSARKGNNRPRPPGHGSRFWIVGGGRWRAGDVRRDVAGVLVRIRTTCLSVRIRTTWFIGNMFIRTTWLVVCVWLFKWVGRWVGG